LFESSALDPENSQVAPIADLYHRAVDEVKAHPAGAIKVAAATAIAGLAVYAFKGQFCRLAEPELPVFEGIADFGSNGKLAPGIYKASWAEFAGRFGTNQERLHLLSGLQSLASDLGSAGCKEIRIGGSFISQKAVPADFDALWMYNDKMAVSQLDTILANDSRFDTRYKYGGDIFSSRTKKIDLGNFLPKHKSIYRWLSEDELGSTGVVSLDPTTVPAAADFHPFSYGPHLGGPRWP
jgi:hypothetical protein